ncbi:MAG: ATP-binding cassette domain-containing protein, partial [Coxiellaceae bacterium]|nr:ATP-binding cassette domain-containing protein [Coxiellaceae bacterium]
GKIEFMGKEISKKHPADIARLGIAHVPENRGTFDVLSVEENLQIGLMTRKDKHHFQSDIDQVYDYFPPLKKLRKQSAGFLSGGEQQMLAIARALLLRPTLMLLDEPSTGLAPKIVQEIFVILKDINTKHNVSILLVEQNVNLSLDIADHVCLLETGNLVLEGTPEEMRQHPDVQKVYLGY